MCSSPKTRESRLDEAQRHGRMTLGGTSLASVVGSRVLYHAYLRGALQEARRGTASIRARRALHVVSARDTYRVRSVRAYAAATAASRASSAPSSVEPRPSAQSSRASTSWLPTRIAWRRYARRSRRWTKYSSCMGTPSFFPRSCRRWLCACKLMVRRTMIKTTVAGILQCVFGLPNIQRVPGLSGRPGDRHIQASWQGCSKVEHAHCEGI
ncbi:hypothetical protein PsYK624_027270 [Phanerochaete sordida]|uniref:Uncharacterized protein n=1 Tax=Phanerochaete sordida TaxID=48140 RepID=A0A9P3G1Q4_9APHY|nr:hypothetical protein PsYK624_027270 [Phanerochaete sordida]